jgi:hypothetical protein
MQKWHIEADTSYESWDHTCEEHCLQGCDVMLSGRYLETLQSNLSPPFFWFIMRFSITCIKLKLKSAEAHKWKNSIISSSPVCNGWVDGVWHPWGLSKRRKVFDLTMQRHTDRHPQERSRLQARDNYGIAWCLDYPPSNRGGEVAAS